MTFRNRFLALGALFLLILGLLAPTPVKASEGLFWRVEDSSGRAIHLLGSFHLATAEFYPLRPAIMDAFNTADRLVVELDVQNLNNPETIELFQVGFNPPSVKLTDQLSPDSLEILRTSADLPLPLTILQTMRPWMASLSLAATSLLKLGYTEEYGQDSFFLTLAKQKSLPIAELETPQEQVSLFTSMSPEEQDLYFKATLIEINAPVHPVTRYMNYWIQGDAEAFYAAISEEYQENPELVVIMKRLIDDRNVSLAARLAAFFERDGVNSFAVIGAAHLVGPNGIPTLLEKAGFKVTRY